MANQQDDPPQGQDSVPDQSQRFAADYVRQQIAQIYGQTTPRKQIPAHADAGNHPAHPAAQSTPPNHVNHQTTASSQATSAPPSQEAQTTHRRPQSSYQQYFAQASAQNTTLSTAPAQSRHTTTIHPTDVHPQHTPASAATTAPASYTHSYNQEAQPQDWQTYHQAWQQYYQEYYRRYFLHHMQQQLAQQTTPTTPLAVADGHTQGTPTHHTAIPAKTRHLTNRIMQTRLRVGGNSILVQDLRTKLLGTVEEQAKKVKHSPHFKPIVTAVIVGVLFLFLQFNRTFIAQAKYYISPGTLTNEGSSIILNPNATATVNPEPRLIIPKINVEVPVVYDEPSYDENKIQQALERGVVHYGNSTLPGEIGNNVIVGHSSNDLFDSGGYKFAFVLLDRLEAGDIIILHHQSKRYIYRVFNKAVIVPTDFSLINNTPDKPILTLITCTPPGTALKRLVVQGEQISPEPDANQVANTPQQPAALPSTIPGNSPTLAERLQGIFR